MGNGKVKDRRLWPEVDGFDQVSRNARQGQTQPHKNSSEARHKKGNQTHDSTERSRQVVTCRQHNSVACAKLLTLWYKFLRPCTARYLLQASRVGERSGSGKFVPPRPLQPDHLWEKSTFCSHLRAIFVCELQDQSWPGFNVTRCFYSLSYQNRVRCPEPEISRDTSP